MCGRSWPAGRPEVQRWKNSPRLTATACPLDVANLNTDQIVPARFLKRPRSAGFGEALLHDLRFDAEGRERPDFPLNQPAWRGARIIVGGRNFGCGS